MSLICLTSDGGSQIRAPGVTLLAKQALIDSVPLQIQADQGMVTPRGQA